MQQHVVPIGGGDVGKFVDSVLHNHAFYNSYLYNFSQWSILKSIRYILGAESSVN